MIEVYPDNHKELYWRSVATLDHSVVQNFLGKLSNGWVLKMSTRGSDSKYSWYNCNYSIPVEHTHSKEHMKEYDGLRLVMWMPSPK